MDKLMYAVQDVLSGDIGALGTKEVILEALMAFDVSAPSFDPRERGVIKVYRLEEMGEESIAEWLDNAEAKSEGEMK
jgi:hypothetical protein